MLSVFTLLIGCSDPAGDMRVNREYPQWPELEKLQSDEILMPIGTALDFGDIKSVKSALKEPQFAEALDAFANSEIPSGFDSEERKAAKEQVVTKFKEAIELAESGGSNDQIKEACQAAQDALRTVSAPIEK